MNADEILEKQRSQWAAAAPGWEKWGAFYERSMEPVVDWFWRVTAPPPDARVLDIACGTGVPCLGLATRLAPEGVVFATDLAPEMVAATGRRAHALGIRNLEMRVADANHLPFGDASFDAVTCAFGLMFVPDPPAAIAEMRRVLKPGGRLAVMVWDEASKSPFFTVMNGPVREILQAPPPPPDAPSAFRLSGPGELAAAIAAGGFERIATESLEMINEYASVDEYRAQLADFAPLLVAAIARMTDDQRARLDAEVRRGAAAYVKDGRLRLPSTPQGAWATR